MYKLYRLLRGISVFLLRIIYRIQIINKDNIPKEGPFIFVGNHKHKYDCISLMSSTKRMIHFMAKQELIDKHGWLFKKLYIIPVDRNKKNKEAINESINYLKKDEIVAIFPEGTFNKTEYVIMPFKYGAVKIASEANVKIVPFAIVGEYKRFRKGIKIIFGKPYYVEEKRDLTKENVKLMNKVVKLMKGENNDKTKK